MKQPHDNWASYYDYVYERTYGDFYRKFTDSAIQSIKDILNEGTIFDFGAGTGRLSIPLKQGGYKVSAIEKSQAMADILVRKAHNLNLNIPVYVCDIADFNNGKANMAMALFTVLSYATTEEHIERIILNVKNHLSSKGYFFFDLPQPIFFRQQTLVDIKGNDFRRKITLTPAGNENVYEYSETCSGIFNGVDFNSSPASLKSGSESEFGS